MKIYTETGDHGKASLFSGERVTKSHERIEACGDVDELNSVLGALIAHLPVEASNLIEEIQEIQSVLFSLGARIAARPDSTSFSDLGGISEGHIKNLEEAIDRLDESLPTLKGFIFPGGHTSAAWAHVARTVCRRAERHTVRLSEEPTEAQGPETLTEEIMYLNRLSDYLFTVARHMNHLMGVPEIPWKK